MKIDTLAIIIYLASSLGLLAYTLYEELYFTYGLDDGANYFRALQNIMHQPMSILLVYNTILCFATISYKFTVWIFYKQIKEMQTMNMLQKIGYKLFEFFYFVYVMEAQFGLEVFITIVIVFLLFIFHNLVHFRAQYLIHTHTADLLDLNYRLLAHFLILLFIDLQLVYNTFLWLFSGSGQGDQPYILFSYYALTIGLTLIQPLSCFFLHFYQIYTDVIINDVDLLQAKLNYVINSFRLVVQILLSLFIAVKFSIAFLFIITIFESIYELTKIYKSYKQVNKFTEELQQLPLLNSEQIQKKQDKTCAICYQDLTDEAVVLRKCQHLFHKECLRQWIIKNSNKFCPKCKTPFESNSTQQKTEGLGVLRERLLERLEQEQKNMENMERQDPFKFKRQAEKQKQKQTEVYRKQKQNIKNSTSNYHKLAQNRQNLLKKKVRRHSKKYGNEIGSVPYGLPTEAVYKRRHRNVIEREKILNINEKMITLLKMEPTKQLLFVPQIQ